mmetsp:Transcript_25783/g.73668  ORF Transcript_25783/g.73668 Transcript_25783/m.73668 type:complete len:275 (+) Transcript_25783:253-1077(+)
MAHRTEVATSPNVVRGRKDRDTTAATLPRVAVHDNLVRADDAEQFVVVAEALRDVRAEQLDLPASRRGVQTRLLARISPHQVMREAPGLAIRSSALYGSNVGQLDAVSAGEAPVHHQHGVVDECGQGQLRKSLLDGLERGPRIFVSNLLLEAVRTVHASSFVVPAIQKHGLRTRDRQREERQDNFRGARAPIDEVAVEQQYVLPGHRRPTEPKHRVELRQLPVQVAHDVQGGPCGHLHLDQHGQAGEQRRGPPGELLRLPLRRQFALDQLCQRR